MGESFRGRKTEEERVVAPTRGLRSGDTLGSHGTSGSYDAVILALRGQAGEGSPLIYSIHEVPNGSLPVALS